jgi:hypothetical protein
MINQCFINKINLTQQSGEEPKLSTLSLAATKACPDLAMSFSVVAKEQTLIRITGCPFHSPAPTQQSRDAEYVLLFLGL